MVVAAYPDRLAAVPRAGGYRVVAALAGVLTFVGAGVGAGLHLVNRGSPTTVGVTDWWAFPLVSAVSFACTGVWLIWVRPRLSIGWLALAVGVINGVFLGCLEYGVWALDRPGGAVAGGLLFWLGNWMWVTSLLLIATVFPLLLPDGRLPSRGWWPALALSVAVVAAESVDWALTPYEAWSPTLESAGAVNPIGIDWIWRPAIQVPWTAAIFAAMIVAFASLTVRLRRSSGEVRQQLKWIFFGVVLTFLLFAIGFV